MIYEMRLIEFNNPSNRTYSNKNCGGPGGGGGGGCKTGFLFCLVDLPFRNPQNCSLGDFTTPVLGSNSIQFNLFDRNNSYKFPIHKLPSVSLTKIILILIKLIIYRTTTNVTNHDLVYTARIWHDDRSERLLQCGSMGAHRFLHVRAGRRASLHQQVVVQHDRLCHSQTIL